MDQSSDPIDPWPTEIQRWQYGIDVNTATREDLVSYTKTKTYQYTAFNVVDADLWELFTHDFKDFSSALFQMIPRIQLQNLRTTLLVGGVYVPPNDRWKGIDETLVETIKEEEQYEWTDEDANHLIKVYREDQITSYQLAKRLGIYAAATPKITSLPSLHTPILYPPLQGTSQSSQPFRSARTSPEPTGPKLAPRPSLKPSPPDDDSHQRLVTRPENGTTQNFGREISVLAKLYTNDVKYTGEDDGFDYKMTIFRDLCEKANVPINGTYQAFSTMLRGPALDYYYTIMAQSPRPSFAQLCQLIKQYFEGPGYNRRMLRKWNAITLDSIATQYSDKSTYQCFDLLTKELRRLHHSLDETLRTEKFIHNKIITACEEHEACRFACFKPSDTVTELTGDIRSSITTHEAILSKNTSTAYFTDRRFHQNGGHRQGKGKSTSKYQGNQRSRLSHQPKSCFICKKETCRSWKHTPEEQEESKAKFRARNKDKFNPKMHQFNKRFDEGFRHYLTAVEGEEDSDSDEEAFIEAFGPLTIEPNDEEPSSSDSDFPPNDQSTYLTRITEEGTASMVRDLANRALVHLITTKDTTIIAPVAPAKDRAREEVRTDTYNADSNLSRYNSSQFYGIIVDTGASKYSTGGYGQFQALQKLTDARIDESSKGMVTVQFGIGSTASIGSTLVNTPIGQIHFHIVNADTPFLLSLADMDAHKVYFNNLQDVLVTQNGDVPVIRRFGHSFLLWDTSLESFLLESFDQNPCYLTTTELQRLHRRFGHPSVQRLQNVLERAGHDVDKPALEYLTKYCSHCQKHGKSPGRFRFTLQDDVEFNYCIVVDVMYINGAPVLHIVDQATRYQSGRFLKNISAQHTWDVLRACWIDTYLGPPDLIATDAGKNFVSKEFKQHAGTMGIKIKTVPIEAHNSIGLVERYHGPLRRAFQIVTREIRDIDKDLALQMAFKAVNDTAGPDGLVPTLLVYGAYPRLTEYDAPSQTIQQRTQALNKATDAVRKLRAIRKINDAMNTRNGPRIDAIHDLPLNSPVLVWREGKASQEDENGKLIKVGRAGHWSGPYTLISMDGESCVVQLPRGPTSFRSTSVKPFYSDSNDDEDAEEEHGNQGQEEAEQPADDSQTIRVDSQPTDQTQPEIQPVAPVKRSRGRPRKNPLPDADVTVFLQEDSVFTTSRQQEVVGLVEKGVFEVIDYADIPEGARIFKSRFVDEIKNKGTDKAFEKSRLVVQAYNDPEKDIVLTQSPTIQRVSQRLILCMAAILRDENTGLYLRDISQAYVQSVTKLNRDFFIIPPAELTTCLNVPRSSILKVVKPLYGVPEAGNHWFKTYHSHHLVELEMNQSTYDSCLLYRNTPFGLVGLQTDDTLFLGSLDFADLEQSNLEKAQFMAKEREVLTADHPIKFNGGLIQLDVDGAITLTQERQCNNLSLIKSMPTSTTSARGTVRDRLSPKDQYVAQRARGAYVASVCQPEASFDLSFAAQVIEPDEGDVKALNKRLQWQIDNSTKGLRFVKLDKDALKLLVFTDASFANNKDLSSQIGFLLVLADESNQANIVHWSSIKCKRVTRSVLASELYAMAHGFDIGGVVKSTVSHVLRINLPLVLCTDSKSLYDCLVKLGTTQEKRLMVDLLCLRQSYERREIMEVKWIEGKSNPADAFTKSKGVSTALNHLISTNTVQLEAVEWVERAEEGTREENSQDHVALPPLPPSS